MPGIGSRLRRTAAANLGKGGRARGFPALRELFGEQVAKAVATWLRYEPGTVKQRHEAGDGDGDPSGSGNNVPLISEDEAGLLFAEQYRGRLKFCADHGTWFRWDGHIWRQNKNGLAFHLCREMVRRMAEDEPEKVRIAAGKAAFSSAVERFARADRVFAVTAEVWDRDPLLLGTPAGTVDLRTGELRPAKPEDAITKSTAVAPADTAECPLWFKFLDDTFGGDPEMIAFAQRWAGYSLTGDTREHALVFGFGEGGNGKSVFVNAHVGIAGDYAVTASMDTFISSHGDKHPTDVAMLRGARMVTASETEEGRQWAESRIKQLTGGDRVTARFMRQDFFSFVPAFKLTIIGNHKPGLRNVDDAARRRFNLVPFTRKPAVPDRQLETKLKAEWPVDPALDDRRLSCMAAGRASPTSEREGRHQDVLRGAGHLLGMAGGGLRASPWQ